MEPYAKFLSGDTFLSTVIPASSSRPFTVITGYNTDIEFEGVTYHVQTEDKGVATPVILSLVYDRGTILASKRLPYDDLLDGDLDEERPCGTPASPTQA